MKILLYLCSKFFDVLVQTLTAGATRQNLQHYGKQAKQIQVGSRYRLSLAYALGYWFNHPRGPQEGGH